MEHGDQSEIRIEYRTSIQAEAARKVTKVGMGESQSVILKGRLIGIWYLDLFSPCLAGHGRGRRIYLTPLFLKVLFKF